jgi:hypothetical protein
MRYLGRFSGEGTLICDGSEIARASYDFDGYLQPKIGVTSNGEIRLAATTLKDVFGRPDVQLRTDDGRLLALRFSEKKLTPADGARASAHVDVTGELPVLQDWHH